MIHILHTYMLYVYTYMYMCYIHFIHTTCFTLVHVIYQGCILYLMIDISFS
jgi:hypothetical protein